MLKKYTSLKKVTCNFKLYFKMRNLILGLMSIGTIVTMNAQTEVIKTTEVKKAKKVNEKGEVYNTKVKVITKKEKETKFDPKQKHKLNQDVVESPIIVDKIIMVDNDSDAFYDTKTKVKYFKYKGNKYDFLIDKNDLLITYKLDDKDITSARAIKSMNNNFYIVEGKEFNGVGYFNKYGDFIIEYRNNESKKVEYAVFEIFKM